MPPQLQRHRPARGVLKRRVRVDQLRAVPLHEILELAEIVPHDVPSDEAGAGSGKRMERAEVAGTIDDDGVAGIDEAAGKEVESLLGAGEYQNVLRLPAESVRDRFTQRRQAFRGPMAPCELR